MTSASIMVAGNLGRGAWTKRTFTRKATCGSLYRAHDTTHGHIQARGRSNLYPLFPTQRSQCGRIRIAAKAIGGGVSPNQGNANLSEGRTPRTGWCCHLKHLPNSSDPSEFRSLVNRTTQQQFKRAVSCLAALTAQVLIRRGALSPTLIFNIYRMWLRLNFIMFMNCYESS